MTVAASILRELRDASSPEKEAVLRRFFKTGPGEYGEGDAFLGLKVPQTREVVKAAKDTPLEEVPELLMSHWHEVRLCGLLLLVAQFEKLSTKRLAKDEKAIEKRDEILTLYLKYAEQANNWDLVDLSAPKILGSWLLLPTHLSARRWICCASSSVSMHTRCLGQPCATPSRRCRNRNASSGWTSVEVW